MPAKDYKDAAKAYKANGDMIMYNQCMFLYHDELRFEYAEKKCVVSVLGKSYGRYVDLCNKHLFKSFTYKDKVKKLGGVPFAGIDRTGSLSAITYHNFALNVTISQV